VEGLADSNTADIPACKAALYPTELNPQHELAILDLKPGTRHPYQGWALLNHL